jgi:pimeloyl-ACP methyl ester carboxylesterase
MTRRAAAHWRASSPFSRNLDPMIQDSLGPIDYDETGTGPTVVLVPGSCSTGAAWRPTISHWENRFRCVTTSLLGYGGTDERRTALDSSIAHEAEIIEAVIRHANAPVHLVGHSFGGLSALAVAQRRRVSLRSLTIIEAPAPELLRMMFEHEDYFAFRKMTDEYFAAYKSGDDTAIAQMIDFYGGEGTFAGWPQRVRDYAVETTPVNLRDWKSVYGFGLTPALLARVRIPTLVMMGAKSHPAVKRANRLLGQCIPNANVTKVADAAHFMISTHAKEVAHVVAQHLAGVLREYAAIAAAN